MRAPRRSDEGGAAIAALQAQLKEAEADKAALEKEMKVLKAQAHRASSIERENARCAAASRRAAPSPLHGAPSNAARARCQRAGAPSVVGGGASATLVGMPASAPASTDATLSSSSGVVYPSFLTRASEPLYAGWLAPAALLACWSQSVKYLIQAFAFQCLIRSAKLKRMRTSFCENKLSYI